MSSAAIMDAIVSKIKSVLSASAEVLASDVSPGTAEEMNQLLGKAMSAGWIEGLQIWLATAETLNRRGFSGRGFARSANCLVERAGRWALGGGLLAIL